MYYLINDGKYIGVAVSTDNLKIAETILKIKKIEQNIDLKYELSKTTPDIPEGQIGFDEETETILGVPSTIRILIDDAEYGIDSVVNMSPEERLKKVLEYEGIIGYTRSILRWVGEYVKAGGKL